MSLVRHAPLLPLPSKAHKSEIPARHGRVFFGLANTFEPVMASREAGFFALLANLVMVVAAVISIVTTVPKGKTNEQG